MAVRRIRKEIFEFKNKPTSVDGVRFKKCGDDFFNWKVTFKGPNDSPYQDGVFILDLVFPKDYPFKPCKLKLVTKVWHKDWHSEKGTECFYILCSDWSPAYSFFLVLPDLFLHSLDTNVCGHGSCSSCSVNMEAHNQYHNNRQLYESKAREWTKLYARDFEQEKIDELVSTLFKGRTVKVSTSMNWDGSFEWGGKAVDVQSGIAAVSKKCKSYYHASEQAIQYLFETTKDLVHKDVSQGGSVKCNLASMFKRIQRRKPTQAKVKIDEEKNEGSTEVPISTGRTYFISHKQADSGALALDLWNGLGGNNSPGAWLDVKNPGGQSVNDMKAGIEECKYFLIILSEGYFNSEFCRLELEYAINLRKEAIMVYNTDNISKQYIGRELAKAKCHGIDLEDWPSALPMSTDINSCKPEQILERRPMKLVRKSKDKKL